MISKLYLYHRDLAGGEYVGAFNKATQGVHWQTCVRSIVINNKPCSDLDSDPQGECFIGQQAFNFLTEVVCGLRSPMLGETEVHGQFKKLLDDEQGSMDPELFKILMAVHFLARKIRQDYLQKLGCQSYGSYARRKLSEYDQVLLVGSGHLANQILPWLVKGRNGVDVLVRDIEKAKNNLSPQIGIRYHTQIKMGQTPEALVIAAPIKSEVLLEQIFRENKNPTVILDMRAESRTDPLPKYLYVVSLDEIFLEIEQNKNQSFEKVSAAKLAIQDAAQDIKSVIGRQLASIKIS